jgi:hypothetical protein
MKNATTNCDYKIKHKTKEDALKAINKYLSQIVMTVDPLAPYYCYKHKCYHVGHSTSREQRKDKWEIMNWWKD